MVNVWAPTTEPAFLGQQRTAVRMYAIPALCQMFLKRCYPFLRITFDRTGIHRFLPVNELQMLANLLLDQSSIQWQNAVQAANDERGADHDEQPDKPP